MIQRRPLTTGGVYCAFCGGRVLWDGSALICILCAREVELPEARRVVRAEEEDEAA